MSALGTVGRAVQAYLDERRRLGFAMHDTELRRFARYVDDCGLKGPLDAHCQIMWARLHVKQTTAGRLGEYLCRFGEREVSALLGLAHELSQQVAPLVIQHEADSKGYVPLFIDGTAIKVDGDLFEAAARGYNGEVQYWLHGVFLGGLWVSGRLHPGAVGVTHGWQAQLDEDVAPLLAQGLPVWARADNAYYNGEFIKYCTQHGWDYSVSVTHGEYRRPILDVVEGLPDHGWSDIGMGESATLVTYQPAGWQPQSYVVIRRLYDGPQRRLTPAYTIILVSRDDLTLAELVRRHRGKQGQENAFKGPLIDMDLHHPPCRKFRANQAFYVCGQ